MKKILLLLLLVTGLSNAQVVNIPDPIFKAKLLSANNTNTIASTDTNIVNFNAYNYVKIDTNNDGEIQVSEASAITYINVSGTYSVNGGINDLTGIEAFVNLKFLKCAYNSLDSLNVASNLNLRLLNCGFNQISALNVTLNTSLDHLDCSYNQLTTLDVSNNTNLTALYCPYNQLTTMSVTQNTLLNTFDCSANLLTAVNIDNLSNLINFYCSSNLLPVLDVSTNQSLVVIQCNGNQLTAIDVTNNSNLGALTFNFNMISSLDVSQNPNLFYLSCAYNPLTTLDLSTNSQMSNLVCNNNQLTYLNIKNGANESAVNLNNNPNLIHICADEVQVSSIQALAPNALVSSYCSFVPGGHYNLVSGIVRFDSDNDGCDSNDPTIINSLHLTITDGIVSSGTFPSTDGSYLLYTLAGSNQLSTALENPAYFSVSPVTTTITTSTLDNVTTQDFCVTPIGVHNDVEVIVTPLMAAQPGFDATYQIVYKNKGNQIVTGTVGFTYDETVLDFVSATVNPSAQNLGDLNWNYTNLVPFESRSITVVLNVNSPSETPAVNIGDVLSYSAVINPISGDELPLDNTFVLGQTVVGSYDPNNKVCLEGSVVSTSKIGDYLHYNINFENTGTFPATFVVVKDMIDTTKFDIATLQVLNASHPMETRIVGNKVEFIFDAINLGPNQHGNVVFKIKTKATLVEGNTVTNNAAIYFDYNFPIETNTASTTFQVLSNGAFPTDNSVVIAPNPTKNNININCNSNIQSIQLFDVQGRVLMTQLVSDSQSSIDISNYTNGIYFVKVLTNEGSKVEKIIKE